MLPFRKKVLENLMAKVFVLIVLMLAAWPGVVRSGEIGTPLTGIIEASSSSGLAWDQTHRCATDSRQVWCWGNNEHGQLGFEDPIAIGLATPVDGLPGTISNLATGAYHSCAVADQRLYCWGDNFRGQLGTGNNLPSAVPVAILPELTFRQVAAGSAYTCAVTLDDRVLCWGNNEFEPLEIMRSADVSISLGANFGCALSDGVVECWGKNDAGQLGDGSSVSRPDPAPVLDLPGDITHLTATAQHVCATNGNRVWCWGDNRFSQTGRLFDFSDPASRETLRPNAVSGISGIVHGLALDNIRSCAVVGDSMECWGVLNSSEESPIAATYWQADGEVESAVDPRCAIVDRKLMCNNFSGQGQILHEHRAGRIGGLPLLSTEAARRPELIVGPSNACALFDKHDLYCWGENWFGQLGQGHREAVSTTTAIVIPGEPDIFDVGFGVRHACAVTDDGLYCWGDNFFNQLGLNDGDRRLEPTHIPVEVSPATRIAAGESYTCLWKPGEPDLSCFGRLPGGASAHDLSATPHAVRTVPMQIGPLRDVSVGREHVCALSDETSSPTVKCFGLIRTSEDYQFGRTLRDVATGLDSIERLSAGSFSNCAHGPDQVVCWGQDHTWPERSRSPERAPFLVTLPDDPAFEAATTEFTIGGRHACASGADGQTACTSLKLRTHCVYEVSVGNIGPGGGLVSCTEEEWFELREDDLGWVPIEALPSIEIDSIQSGDQFSCALSGRWVRCWGHTTAGHYRYDNSDASVGPVLRAGGLEPSTIAAISFEPTASCPAFIVSRVSLLEADGEQTAGAWGLEANLRQGRTKLHGGLHFGGYANAAAHVPGFAAFRIDNENATAQAVKLLLRGDGGAFTIEVDSTIPGSGRFSRVYAEDLTLDEIPTERVLFLTAGFHIVRMISRQPGTEPALFNASAMTTTIDGGPASFRYGAVVGGYLDDDLRGYTAFCSDGANALEVSTQGRNDRGLIGAGDLRLEIENRSTGELMYDSLNESMN